MREETRISMLTFTNIQHDFRKENGLTCNDYVLLDMVYFLSNESENSWCYAKRDTLASDIGVSKRTIINMINAMIEAGFLEKNLETNYLKTTKKWSEVYLQNSVKKGVQILHEGCKNFTAEVQKLHGKGAKVARPSNNNIYNNIKKEREENALDFFKNNFPSAYETFCMQYKSKIKDFQHFEKMFELKSEEEELKYEQKVIKARLERFAINYIAIDEKQSKVIPINSNQQTNNEPAYRDVRF